ncbi:MAG: endopeptidase La [Desulfobacterales bacterium]
MDHYIHSNHNTKQMIKIPKDLPMLPLRNTMAYPFAILPLVIGIPRSIKLIEDALDGDRLIGLLAMKDPSIAEPQPDRIYKVGTVAMVSQVTRTSGNMLQVVVQGIERFKVVDWLETEPYLKANIVLSPDEVETGIELDALQRSLRDLAKEVVALSPHLTDQMGDFLNQVEDPRYLVYLVAANAGLKVEDGQKIMEMDRLNEKLTVLIAYLTHEKEMLKLGKKIQSNAKKEIDKTQRDYYLRQQLKAIQKELGETDETQSVISEYFDKIEKADLPEEAKKETHRELKRLEGMSPQSPEYSVIKTYLDWMVELPWSLLSEDRLEINHARVVLDEDHYDLQEVKDRVIEYLAVRKLIKDRVIYDETAEKSDVDDAMGVILCFAGPPGVGKTSLGQSIARALGRKFTRMSLGGMRDEAEIRGHRRTYIGAMPGRIIQAIKRSGTRNPVFMLDEVDKVGSDWRGDPSSALLEVLDPAQNHAFRDHYLDVDFDLSNVIFITTANNLETIPPPLRDRMEIIQLDGYTEYEKIRIAQGFLIPRQFRANGLREDEIVFMEEALGKIVRDYTREAGVRNLERQIGAICRKVAVKIAAGESTSIKITSEIVREYLKKEKFESESSEAIEVPGIATGLAVTRAGGDIIFIEATRMKGSGKFILTGQLGDVMRESAQIAYSYVRSKVDGKKVDPKMYEQSDVHVHVPAGAIPKDGPSAGIAMVMAITSLFTCRPVDSSICMTGEVTLRGRVMPVGGVKMKILAAHRAGLTTVILPKRNERDLDELPDEVRKDMNFLLVERIDEALKAALLPCKTQTAKPDVEREEIGTPDVSIKKAPAQPEVNLH